MIKNAIKLYSFYEKPQKKKKFKKSLKKVLTNEGGCGIIIWRS
jgi:hypothetical protein